MTLYISLSFPMSTSLSNKLIACWQCVQLKRLYEKNSMHTLSMIVTAQCINACSLLFSLSLSLSFSLCAQPRAPLYAYAQMTEEQRIQLVQRLTLIQCLPCGRYADTSSSKEEKKSLEVDLEESTTTGSGGHCEKKGDKGDKGDKDRE